MIQVLGAGFSGLSIAYFLKKYGHEVTIVETEKTGGLLQSRQTPHGLVETAANALLANAVVEDMARDIGVELLSTLPSAKKRFIYRNEKMRRWPLSFVSSMRMLCEVLPRFMANRKAFTPLKGESVLAWGQKHIGLEATKYLLLPALSGVYAGDPAKLSASLVFGRFFSGARIPRGKLKGSVAPRGGMGEWTQKCETWLKEHGVSFRTDFQLDCETTIVAIPPPKAASFLATKAPRLARALAKIPMNSLLTATAFFSGSSIDGFGCLFPREENFRALGVLANDKIFIGRSHNCHSETWILGGALDPAVLTLSEDEIRDVILKDRAKLLGLEEKPLAIHVTRWPQAIPHYSLELEFLLPELQPENSFIPFGTYLGDLGLARVLLRARNLARTL